MNKYVGGVQAVTGADVQKFVGSRLGAPGANIVIVGDAKEFLEPLRKEFGEVEVIPAAQLDLNAATLRKAGDGAMKE